MADLSALGLTPAQIAALKIYVLNEATGEFEALTPGPTDCTVDGSQIATCVVPISGFSIYALISPADGDSDGVFDQFGDITDVCPADPNIVDGFEAPLAALVPVAETEIPTPENAFKQGRTLPLKLRFLCGDDPLTGDDEVIPPEIVELVRVGDAQGLPLVDLDSGQSNDDGSQFRPAGTRWIFNLKTKPLSPGIYRITIRMPDGTRFHSEFELR